MLFALAMMGNGTYGLSVIVVLPALAGSKQAFILKHLAWLIGSLGVLLLDFFVSFFSEIIISLKKDTNKEGVISVSVV
jgi:hypothetical protein